jgi:predicted transcriptional regulator
MPTIRNSKRQLTPLELRIMQVLWVEGPSSVQTVQSSLAGGLAYTTVQTMLNVLQRKGHVTRTMVGRAFEYKAIQNRERALGSAVRDLLIRMFDGSVESLVMNLVRNKQLDAAKLAELAEKVARAEGGADANRG